MASVRLTFLPPEGEGITKLHVFESPTATGIFNEIDVTSAVGTYPNYIDHYTTILASSPVYWFAILWEDAGGAKSDLSAPMQGGTSSLPGILVSRMLLRDQTLDELVAAQEAEAAISDYYNTLDPYSIDPLLVSPKIISGLTNLALARSYITAQITSSASNKWVAGIVSVDNSSSNNAKSADAVRALIDLANRDLGRNFSIVLLLEEVAVAGGMKQLQGVDLSRLMIEIQ